MTIYRLEPIAGTEGHADWYASTVPPTPVWLQAKDSDHARQKMHLATTNVAANSKDARTPWTNIALVRCTEDRSRQVPADMALLANGGITIKLG